MLVALIAGGATTLTAAGGLGSALLTQRGKTREANAAAALAERQLEEQRANNERDDAHRLVELANQLGGTWIDRLTGEVNNLREQLVAAQRQIVDLTAQVARLTEEVRDRHELRAQLEKVTAERDHLYTELAARERILAEHNLLPLLPARPQGGPS